MKNFEELGLSSDIVNALTAASITTPTEIQTLAIPILLTSDTDFIALAQTGTGKTAAFGLPLIENIDLSQPVLQSIVLAPTRELAQQIAVQLTMFSKQSRNIEVAVVFGGVHIMDQIKDYRRRKPQILIATPGRLIDLIKRKVVKPETVSTVVLDEADEMLNMGFKEDIEEILGHMTGDQNIWLFSATMEPGIRRITQQFMENPEEVIIHKKEGIPGNSNISHQYCMTKASQKAIALERFIDINPNIYGLVFCRTKRDTKELSDQLTAAGYVAEVLNGDLSQEQRDEAMARFRKKTVRIMVATDVAARGIDVQDLTHVFHFNIPDEMAFYTHRSGRTGRAGKHGISLVLTTQSEKRKLDFYARKLKINFELTQIPDLETIKSIKLQHYIESLTNIKEDFHIDDDLIGLASSLLVDYSKEQLIDLLVRRELKKWDGKNANENINIKEKSQNKNVRSGKDGRDGNRRERRRDNKGFKDNNRGEKRAKASKGMHRFFINVGKIDKVNKKDLVEFISETANIKKKDIGDVDIDKKHSFFEINKESSKKIVPSFQDLFIDDRAIRVNRDN